MNNIFPHRSTRVKKNNKIYNLMDTEPRSCTTILVGKNATYDGSTMMARTEDAPAGEFTPKKHIVVKRTT